MTIKYYIRDHGNGPYCEGPEDDFSWQTYGADSIEVPQRPSLAHVWNGSQWILTEESLRNNYEAERIRELRRTDIYKHDTSLTLAQQQERDAYYATLLNLDFADTLNFDFPKPPPFMRH